MVVEWNSEKITYYRKGVAADHTARYGPAGAAKGAEKRIVAPCHAISAVSRTQTFFIKCLVVGHENYFVGIVDMEMAAHVAPHGIVCAGIFSIFPEYAVNLLGEITEIKLRFRLNERIVLIGDYTVLHLYRPDGTNARRMIVCGLDIDCYEIIHGRGRVV